MKISNLKVSHYYCNDNILVKIIDIINISDEKVEITFYSLNTKRTTYVKRYINEKINLTECNDEKVTLFILSN